ncbi:hypothetical protein EYF80_054830 [Liparis tanakae]|uniref:Uncharacterized protein n=1 Tax=Liparis tanakae TaxID=230148 RepID=A0A4Z2F1C4_9TELE|nr:hypothetical protein EYF80_054830 [Liparis tanakae]
MVQAAPLELQWRLAPVSLSAATWKCWASGLGDQDTAMVPPASHGAATATTCPYVRPLALHAGTGLVAADHAHVVGGSAPRVDQVAVRLGGVAFRPVASVCGDAHGEVGERSARPLPSHGDTVGAAPQGRLDVGGPAGH